MTTTTIRLLTIITTCAIAAIVLASFACSEPPPVFVEQTVEVIKEVQVTVPVEIEREVEVTREVPVTLEVEVIKEVQVTVPVEIEREIEVTREVPVTFEVEVTREVPVQIEVEVTREVPVQFEVEVTREVPIPFEVEVTREVTIEIPVTVEVPATVEVPIEVTREVTIVVEVTREVETIVEVTSTPTPIPRNDCDYDAVLRYTEVMGPAIDEVTTSFLALGSLFDQVAEDPLVLTDSSWLSELELELGTLERSARSINMISPPAILRAAHREWESAADKILRATPLIRQGVENLDSDSLLSATTLLEEISAHFIRGATELDQWNDRCGT